MGNIPATSSGAGIDHINIVSYDDTLLDYAKGNIAQGTLNEVYGDSNKVATVFNKNNSLKVGDTIQIAGTEVEISCALSQGLFGDDLIIICSQEAFDRLMGQEKYGLIGVQLGKDATDETVAQIRNFENDNIIILSAELAGVNEEDMEVNISEGILSISGVKKSLEEEYSSDDYFYKIESVSGKFCRSFAIPANINTSAVKASLKDGVLKIILQKTNKQNSKTIKIKSE